MLLAKREFVRQSSSSPGGRKTLNLQDEGSSPDTNLDVAGIRLCIQLSHTTSFDGTNPEALLSFSQEGESMRPRASSPEGGQIS